MLNTLEIFEAIGKLIEGAFGVRYIFSSKYRNKVHERCRDMTKGGIFYFAFVTLSGIELMRMIKKKQMALEESEEGLSAAEQVYALAS